MPSRQPSRPCLARPADLLRRFARARDGAVAIIFIVALIPLMIAAGAAIDLSRAYVVKQRLGFALDAAGLAVGSSVGEQDELQAVLEKYFEANYPVGEMGVPATPSMVINGNEIEVSADAEIDATLMRIVGVDKITVSASATIVRKVTGLDVVLVLDNSTSMAGSKINALKQAATSFVEILFGDEETSETLQIGIVPFAGTVNIGKTNTTYIRSLSGHNPSNFSPYDWEGRVEARSYPLDVQDTYNGTTSHKWVRYIWPSNSNNDWPPESGTPRGQNKGPNKFCVAPILPLTGTKQTLIDYIPQLEANGTTHINLGAVWGWRVLSPQEPFTGGHEYDDENFNHAVVIMTDGENYISSSNKDYSSYRRLQDGLLGTTNKSVAESRLDSRLLEVCSGMKALGIIVYTIAFDISTNALRTLMTNCATDPTKYFESPTEAELKAAFQTIGAQLSNLRLGR